MRSAVAVGFYPSSKEELEKVVRHYLISDKKINALGAIVPHAGYQFSGHVAGATLKAAKTDKKSFVLFGPNHTGYGSAVSVSNEDWGTPLGIVKTDKELVKRIGLGFDELAHQAEHSLEVQLPFLQILYKDFSIVPIALRDVGFEQLEEIAKLFDKNSFYIASSDFTHFGPMYGYEPVAGTIKEQINWVKEIETGLIDLITKLKAKEFYNTILDNGYTVCGFVPITLLMLIMKSLGAKKGELIKRATSYEVSRDSSFVSYVGLVFS